MIVISSGKMTIPENEWFIGFADDNLHSSRQFLLTDVCEQNCTYRLHLKFVNGATTHLDLDSSVENGSTILTWNILSEHILCNGQVEFYIKAIDDDGEVYRTKSECFLVGPMIEFEEDNSYLENYGEVRLQKMVAQIVGELLTDSYDLVRSSRKIAGLSLENDITKTDLLSALGTYPVKGLINQEPTEATVGNKGQLLVSISGSVPKLYMCAETYGVGINTRYMWVLLCDMSSCVPITREIAGVDLSENITAETLCDALQTYPLLRASTEPTQATAGAVGQMYLCTTYDGETRRYRLYYCSFVSGDTYNWVCFYDSEKSNVSGENGLSAYEIAQKNGFEGTVVEWLESLQGPQGEKGETGAQGPQGEKGETGSQGLQGEQGLKGDKGDKGDTGAQGEKGADGYTPVKGTDYFTESDKAEIVGKIIEQTEVEIIPDYVVSEADSVTNRVLQAQGNKTFTLAAITDLHYGNSNYKDGIKHAFQAMNYISKQIKLDMVAVLGDYTDNYPSTDITDAMADFKAINSMLDGVKFAPNIRQMGNHDYYADNIPVTSRLIQSHSDNVVWGDRLGGYFYRDFEDYKLRVICLNTNENNPIDTSTNNPTSNISMTSDQCQWFADTLDMSSKGDADEWQILVLSHQPLDYWATDSAYRLSYIVDAYKNGTSWNDSVVSCDYTGKNQAVLIGNIHGHIHNLLTDTMYRGNSNSSEKTSVYRLSTPNACFGRENQYTGVFSEATTYSKTQNSALDTAFVVYCIDLDTYTIKAICYGAGYDRELVYNIPSIGYTNQLPIAIDTDGSIYNGKGFIDDTRLNSSGATESATGASTTGFISVSENAVVRLKNVGIATTDSTTDYIHLYDENFTYLIGCKTNQLSGSTHWINTVVTDETTGYITSFTLSGGYGAWDSVKYMRLSTRVKLDDTAIITVNEKIE